jgi:hypothetical protein
LQDRRRRLGIPSTHPQPFSVGSGRSIDRTSDTLEDGLDPE